MISNAVQREPARRSQQIERNGRSQLAISVAHAGNVLQLGAVEPNDQIGSAIQASESLADNGQQLRGRARAAAERRCGDDRLWTCLRDRERLNRSEVQYADAVVRLVDNRQIGEAIAVHVERHYRAVRCRFA